MLNQDPSSEVVPYVSTLVPNVYNMQQFGVQYFPPPPSTSYVYSDAGGAMIPSDTSPRPQWQDSAYVGGPGNYIPQQSGGPAGGANQQIRLSIQPPSQSGPPPSQPTPTSTPPGVDMKPSNHMPGQAQLQQGNFEIGAMYVPQNQAQRPPGGNQNYHNTFQQARMPAPRLPRNQGVAMAPSNVQNLYQLQYGMMQPIPQGAIMMNVQQLQYPGAASFQNQQRHQGQNSNHSFYPSPGPILVGPNTQPYFNPGGNYFPPMMRPPHYVQSNPGAGPVSQAGAPPGPIPPLTSVPSGMMPPAPSQASTLESKKSRKHAIPIINPDTGVDIFTDQPSSGNNNNFTPPGSNDSSARETPQPVSLPQSPMHPQFLNPYISYYDHSSGSDHSVSVDLGYNPFSIPLNSDAASFIPTTCNTYSTPPPLPEYMTQSPPGYMITPPPEPCTNFPSDAASTYTMPFTVPPPLQYETVNYSHQVHVQQPLVQQSHYFGRIAHSTSDDSDNFVDGEMSDAPPRIVYHSRQSNYKNDRRTNRGPRHRKQR